MPVLALAILVRILYFGYYYGMPDWDQLTVDNYYHHHWAQSIAAGNIFGDTTYFRAPFYVYCLALLYTLFGTSLWVSRVFGALVGLGSVAVTYLIGKRIFSAKIGLVAALLQSLHPVMIYFEGELLLDPLFTLLLQLAVYGLLVWFEKKAAGQALVTGLLLGLALITRPTALVFIPLIVLAMAASLRNAAVWAKHSVIFVLAVLVVIAPIFVRNLVVAGDWVPVASQGGINFYIGNNSNADGVSAVLSEPLGHNWRLREITYLAEQEVGKRLKPGQVSSFWANKAFHWMSSNPKEFIRLYLKKLYRNFSDREISNNRDLDSFFNEVPILKYNPLSFGWLFTLTIAAIMAGSQHRPRVLMLLLFVLVYVLAASLFFFNSRFRLPLLPYYFVLAVLGLFNLIDRLRSSRRSRVPLLFGVGCAALFSFYPLVPLPRGSSPIQLTSKGLHYYAKEDFRQAMHYHRLALTVDSTFPETNLNLGACYFKLGLADSAQYYFEREKRFNPDRVKAFTNIASLHLVNGRYGEALVEVKQALSRKPYDVLANMVLMRAAAASREIDGDSLVHLAFQAGENTGNDIYVLNEAAGLLAGRGDLSAAESLLLRALNSRPPPIETDDEAFTQTFRNSLPKWEKERAKANYQLGYVYGLQGRYREATLHSSLAIERDSSLIEAYVNLVSGLVSLGQRQEADSILAVAIGKFPASHHLRQLRDFLEK